MGTINHFSHSTHALTAVAPNASLRCSFCKRSKCTSKRVYACYTCDYFLGSICAMLKEQTNVPAHQLHPLTLVQPSATEKASRSCRACGGRILGWRYSCSCNYDLHALCALWPRTITTSCHQHPLYLDFPVGSQLRGGSGIGCNRCGHGDRALWGYACGTCGYEFYHHLDCAAAIDPSEDPADLLDRLLDVTETVVEVARAVETVVDVADTIGNKTPVVSPTHTIVVNGKTSDDDSDCDCGCDDEDCAVLSACAVCCCSIS